MSALGIYLIWLTIPLPLFVNVVYGYLPVYCVPAQNNTIDVQLWRQMVDPRQCPGTRPNRISECNRIPCPAKWVSSGNYSLFFTSQNRLYHHFLSTRLCQIFLLGGASEEVIKEVFDSLHFYLHLLGKILFKVRIHVCDMMSPRRTVSGQVYEE